MAIRTSIRNDANATDTNVSTYQGTLYGNHAFGDSNYFIGGMGAFGFDRNQATRHDVGGIAGLPAHADYDSWQGAGRLEAGKNFYMGGALQGLAFTPSLTANYLHYSADGYTETGANGADLTVGRQAENTLQLGIGGRLQYLLKSADSGVIVKPDIHASYQYDVLDKDHVDTTASLAAGGGTFTTNGLNPSNATVTVGTGLKIYDAGPWDFSASADYTAKADYNAYSGTIRVGYKF